MRLFIAINFDEKTKTALWGVAQRLKENAVSGNFTHRENMHLTLAFIGETKKLPLVKAAMAEITAAPFDLHLRGLGSFKRPGGGILWLGVEKCAQLARVQAELTRSLYQKGFPVEQREYRPHLTLGREVVLRETFDQKQWEQLVGTLTQRVLQIDLMESKRIGGKLVYTCLYSKALEG